MEQLYRKTFYSWNEEGEVKYDHDKKKWIKDKVRTIALCDGTWFYVAINALRDGDMGEKDENGVYERRWWADDIYNTDVEDVRPANLAEVELYLKYCNLDEEAREDGREVVAIIKGKDRTDVIFRSMARK